MTEQTTGAIDNTMVLRVPKPNVQVAILGLVAIITLFQTFQLIRISGANSSTPAKTAPVVSGTAADAPQSQVGGC